MLKRHRLLLIIVGIHIFFGIVYGLVTPPWESSDEWEHMDYVIFLKDNHRLPTEAEVYADPRLQLKQMPLYYAVSALIISPIDTSDFARPFENIWLWLEGSGRNWTIHPDYPPLYKQTGSLLALRVLRMTSTLWGAVGVVMIYCMMGLLTSRKNIVLLATFLIALTPRYIYTTSVVNNDPFVTMWATVFMYFIVRLYMCPFRWRDMGGLLIALALALMSKSTAVALLPIGGLMFLILVMRYLHLKNVAPRHIMLIMGVFVLGAIALVAGYLFFALDSQGRPEPFLPSIGTLLDDYKNPSQLEWDAVPRALKHAYYGFWGQFGYENIELPQWILVGIGLFLLISWIGIIAYFRRGTVSQREVVITFGLLIIAFCTIPTILVLQEGYIYLFHGRYLMPTISAVIILFTLGWVEFYKLTGSKQWVFYTPAVLLFALTALIPITLIHPVYARPELIDALPDGYNAVDVTFGDGIQLIGYQPIDALYVGEPAKMRLCWQALEKMETNYLVEVKLLDTDFEQIADAKALHGNGNYATSLWEIGDRFCDYYQMEVSQANYPMKVYWQVLIHDFNIREARIDLSLPVYNENKEPMSGLVLMDSKLHASRPREYTDGTNATADCNATEPAYFFVEEGINLSIASAKVEENQLEVRFCWQATQSVSQSYRVFVQVIGESASDILAQGDGEPTDGLYPPQFWDKNDQVSEVRYVTLPDSLLNQPLTLNIGLYNPLNGQRLTALDGNNQPLANNAIVITVEEE